MRILILGGTQFMGSFLTEALLERGDEVTLLHRGRSQAHAFEGARHAVGDRADGYGSLPGERWDVVVDTSGYVPAQVQDAARQFAASAARYLFISSVSAYAGFAEPGIAENDALLHVPADERDAVLADVHATADMERYGEHKALSEAVVLEAFGTDRCTIVRPGIIVGPRDPTGRFTYWVERARRGGELLAPAAQDQPLQVIDARDLAAFVVRLIDDGRTGAYNATWPPEPLSFGDLVDAAVAAQPPGHAAPVWADGRWLTGHEVEPWNNLPLWLGPDPEEAGLFAVDVSRGVAAGLLSRSLAATVESTLRWLEDGGTPVEPPTIVSTERERDLLAEWHAANGTGA